MLSGQTLGVMGLGMAMPACWADKRVSLRKANRGIESSVACKRLTMAHKPRFRSTAEATPNTAASLTNSCHLDSIHPMVASDHDGSQEPSDTSWQSRMTGSFRTAIIAVPTCCGTDCSRLTDPEPTHIRVSLFSLGRRLNDGHCGSGLVFNFSAVR